MKRFIATIAAALGFAASGASAETIVSVTQTSYDYLNHPVCSAVRMNTATFTALPSDPCALAATSATYGPDRITKNQYDAAGQLTDIIRAYGVTTANGFPATLQQTYAHYTYTNNGLKQTETDANGNKTTYVYDGFDRLSQLQYPSTTIGSGVSNTADYEAWGYDANGNKTSWRRRDGQTFGYAYDNLNQETLKDVPGGTSADVYTGYDGMGNVLWRRFNSTAGTELTVSYTYDGLGRVSSTTDMNGRTIWYTYNQASVRTQLTFPDITNIGYGRDNANRISTIGVNAITGLVGMTYDSLGRLTGIARQGGSTSYGFDNVGRLTSMGNDLNGTTYDIAWTFGYNPAGQLYTSSASSTTYDYKETVNSSDTPTYDGLNRDTRQLATTNFCTTRNLTGYDARQNLTCDSFTSRTFTYDVENRLTGGTSSQGSVVLVYDPEGRLSRYSKDGGATYLNLLYDGTDIIAFYAADGSLISRYVHGDGTDDPLVWLIGSGTSDMRPLYTDYHGSIIATYADSTGNNIAVYKYGPYGEPKDINNNELWTGPNFRYTGQFAIPMLQVYHYKARAYDPKWGRFLQTDPIGSKDDLDLYAYVKDDPVNGSDPTGLCGPACPVVACLAFEPCAAAVVATGVAVIYYGGKAIHDIGVIINENRSGPVGVQITPRSKSGPEAAPPPEHDPNRDDKKRQKEQRDRRNDRREKESREQNGQNQKGNNAERYWGKQNAKKGPSGDRPKGPDRSNNRERNVGVEEEHSMKAKGQQNY